MNIILIGYKGTGKGIIGKALAKRIGYGFLDTDDLVEERAGKTVLEIFREIGEPGFRNLESLALKQVCLHDKCVIATGGGSPMKPENFNEIEKCGLVILLESTPEEIGARLEKEPPRPALTDINDHVKEAEFLLKKRSPTYRALADFTVKTNGKRVEENVREIVDFLKAKKHI